MKKEIKFSLVYRDMWQSSGKYQPRADQLAKIAPLIVEMGCFARVETNGGAFEQVNLLYGENPNKAVRTFTKPLREAGIQTHMLDRGLNALRMYPVPADVRRLMYRVKHAQGVDITRIFCGLNEVRNIIPSIKYAKEAGMIPQATLCITYSPVHTVDYYSYIADQLIEAGAPEICLKDMAGIGRPEMLGQLVRNIKDKHPEVIVQYHGHSGPGLSMASILEVCENGADIIDVAMEPLSWGKVHPDVISVQAMLKNAGFQVPEINMKAYMKARSMTQEFIDDFLGYFIDPTNKHMSLGYPPLVTPFSQYVKNVALMNVMQLVKGEERWTMIDNHTWDMILGKSGKLPGALAPEIIELAKSKGYEFTDEDPQVNYPDELDKYRKEMDDNGWEYGEDEEELFELAMHDRQYRDYKSGVAKKRFMDDLQRAQDAAMVKSGFDEETIRKYKRAKADPIIAPDKGQILWEVSVEGPSMAPFVGRKYQHDEVFCYISTPWGEYEKIFANFTGRIVEVCAQQGAVVNKGDVIAYLERTEFTA